MGLGGFEQDGGFRRGQAGAGSGLASEGHQADSVHMGGTHRSVTAFSKHKCHGSKLCCTPFPSRNHPRPCALQCSTLLVHGVLLL